MEYDDVEEKIEAITLRLVIDTVVLIIQFMPSLCHDRFEHTQCKQYERCLK